MERKRARGCDSIEQPHLSRNKITINFPFVRSFIALLFLERESLNIVPKLNSFGEAQKVTGHKCMKFRNMKIVFDMLVHIRNFLDNDDEHSVIKSHTDALHEKSTLLCRESVAFTARYI